MLVIHARLSLNMAAHTLEQVLNRRRKMLMDMSEGIALELRDKLDAKLAPFAVRVLKHALEFDALSEDPDWFNNDENFANVMASTLKMQHELVREVGRLKKHENEGAISFAGKDAAEFKGSGHLGSRATMLLGWVIASSSRADLLLDLRNCNLTSEDGTKLAKALDVIPRLTSIDVRGNPGLDGEGAARLLEAMRRERPGHPRSLCGVSSTNLRLDVPRHFELPRQQVDLAFVVGELECHVYAESVTAGMGGAVSGDVIQLNRRGIAAADKGGWAPLNWAAKTNHLQVGEQMLKNGTNVNVQDAPGSHSKCWSALHTCAFHKHTDFARLLLQWGIDVELKDVNGATAKDLAKKKGFTEIVELIEGGGKAAEKAEKPEKPDTKSEKAEKTAKGAASKGK